ncbi:MAG: methyltransferase domain-containing protein [Caldilineaceae bacterium]
MSQERLHWEERYQQGNTPWDTRITPPEVVQFWAKYPMPANGIAIDLGCGAGTNAAYLAQQGYFVIGCDLAGNALQLGKDRLQREQVALLPRIQFLQVDVTRLPLRHVQANYILDIGCFHGLPPADRPAYVQGVLENLAPGGYYQLFAFDLLPDKAPRGVAEDEVQTRFAPRLQVVEVLRGRPDRQACRWYLLQKK